MTITTQNLHRMALLVIAPFIGLMLWLLISDFAIQLDVETKREVAVQPQQLAATDEALTGLEQARQTAGETSKSLTKQIDLYKKTNAEMEEIAKVASSQAGRPLAIYDRQITSRLGKPSSTISSDKLRAQLFYVNHEHFRGYAVKLQLKSPDAMNMVMGGDKPGEAMTTLQAVKHYGAAVGVNAGGYADAKGKRYPLSTTIADGKYITGFEASYADLFFVGMNDKNKLIGGKFAKKEQLDAKNPKFGASFVPILIKNGAAQDIPAKWQTSPKRAPRTVIANYKDDQLLILVADGYNEGGSSGATLSELQTMLKRYGVVDAYNLDGGGSSSLVFNGKLVNKPSDGKLRKLPTHFLFFK
ncbi:phosphodiester glycosidase family protein [Paenibacillus sp. J5C_2022]|uniref:phosphodiester glycosidase family protein n=1 Tax=Paenibacillus sp. J5C2022 TaxID=2977129 RepID=UPI0021D34444|nr:phosphodiester glycosidase family protein [Paenibacillus sp. J5C2022]MCU6711231.1 phosphodiester glycosidase family protein [Paenibacillus sp. J5C2022]